MTAPHPPTGDPATAPARAGVIRARRGLPGSRAAVGGLLVVLAALGTWFLAGGADEPPRRRYVAAATDLAPGHRLAADDLTVVELDLPPDQQGRAFAHPDEVVGAAVLGPIRAGELIQTGVVTAAVDGPDAQFSFEVERAWAVGGSVEVGDRIDLYASTDDGAERVLTNVTVHAVGDPAGGLGDAGRQTITVGGPDADSLGRAVAAARGSELTVVRVTDARGADEPPSAAGEGGGR